jgi:HK97 family phage prohead protease
MSQGTFDDIHFKAMNGQFNIDEAQGIVECFVAAVGNKDSVGDIVASGAFTESLKRRKPRVVWGHNWNDPIGKVLEIYEVPAHDPRLPGKMKQAGVGGLYAKVQFNLATEKGREAFASVAFFGGDQEWSIGYKTLQANFDSAMQANVLREVELYEVSPVLHGANQLTATISVKSDEGEKCHTPAMGAGRPMIPAVMRAFNPGPAEVNPLRILERISEDISNPREDIFAEGEARVLNPEEKYRLEQELMERSNNRLKIISATENMVTFHRLLPNGTSTAYRLPYHYDNGTRQYMFGKPEKMGQGPDQPQPQTVVPMQMPSMPMSVKPNVVSPYTMVNGEYAGEKSIEEKLHEVISGLKLPIFDDEVAEKSQQEKIEEVVGLLQSYIEEKSEPMRVVMKCEPHQAFYVKQLLDPVIEYHGLEAQVSEKGVHLSGTFSDEVLDALYVSEKSIQRMFMKEGGWGKGDGPSGPTFQVEVKALGGRVGQRIGGGLSAAPPGMVWVDVTGAIDGDSDGIVFEGTPMQRPIIPRAMIPKAQAGILQGASLPRAMQIERDRDNTGSRSKRNNEDGGKERKFRPRLSAEEVRISQEQKLRSNKIPKKRKPGPSADEWRPDNSRSRRNVRLDNNLGTYDPWKNRDSGTERLLGNEFSIPSPNDDAVDNLISSSRSTKLTAKEIIDNLAYFNMYKGLSRKQVMDIIVKNDLIDSKEKIDVVEEVIDDIINRGGKIVLADKNLLINFGGNKLTIDLSNKKYAPDEVFKDLKGLLKKDVKIIFDPKDLHSYYNYIKPTLEKIKDLYGDNFIIRVGSGGHYDAVLINPITGEDMETYGFSGTPQDPSRKVTATLVEFTKASLVKKFDSLVNWRPITEILENFPLRKTYPGETPKFGPLVGDSELLQVYTGMELPSTSTQYPNGLAEIEMHDIGEGKFGIYGVIIDEDGVEHLISQEVDSLANAFDFARSLGSKYSLSQITELREAISRRLEVAEQLDEPRALTSEIQEMMRAKKDRTFGEWHVDSSRSQRKPTLTYNTAAKSIREIFADENTWEPFFKDLNEVLRHSQNESQRLLDLYDDPNATEEAINSLEQSIRDLDEQIAAVIDYAKMLNGENRRARLKKLAIPLVQKMIDERDGAEYSDFTDEEIDLLRDRLTYTDQLIQDIFGEEGSDKSRKFVESMQEALDDAEWYDGILSSPIEDEDNRDYLESPSRELYDEVAKSIEIEVGYIKDARKRNHQKRLAVSDGHNFTDNNSRSKRSFSNGRGVGESRQVFPSNDIKTSNKIKYARYDGRKQELLVEYSSGQTTTYGGITENMVSTLEKSTDSIDNAINAIKKDARYSIKANGEIEGRATSIAAFVNRDIERLASYGMLTAKDKTMMQLAANAIASDFAEPPEHELLTLSDYLTGIANELIRKYEENSAALNLLEIKDAIDDRIGNGLGGKRGTRMYRPLQKETTLDLTSDEIGELRDEIQEILNKHGDRMTFAPFTEFDKALKDAQDGNKNSVTIQDNLHSALTVAYDELYWMALNNQAEKKWLNPIGEAPLNLAAASGRFSSPRLKANRGDFNGVPFNNGAPSRMTPEARIALIDWANGDGAGLQVLRGIRDSYRTRNGNLTPRQWNTLASMYRRFGPGGSESTSKSKKDTEIYYSIVPSDIPEQLDDGGDDEVAETVKPSKPKGKPASELLPDDFDSMTAKEKIDVMFQIGLATKDNPNGIMQEDWNRLIYPLDKELDVEEAVRNQAEFVAAQEAAAIRGEMLTEEEFYEQKSRQAELNDRRTIRHALSEYDAGRPELLAKLGLRRENFIVKVDREFKAPTKPKPLGKWALDFSMKIRTQIEKASSNGLAGDEHLDPWLSMEDLINDNDGLLDEETIQKIIPVLEDYVSAYDGAEFGHRSEGNSYKQAQDMIEELENTLTILLDPTILDDDSSDDEDKPKNPEVPTDSLAPDSSDSSSRSRRSSSEDLRLIIEPGNRRYPRNFRPNSRTPGFNDIDPSVIEYLKKIKYDLDKDKDKENSRILDDIFFAGGELIRPSYRFPIKWNQYKDLTDEELISKVSSQKYPSNAVLHELSVRGYAVYKKQIIGKKSFGGGWVEDYDVFLVKPFDSPTPEHLNRRKSLYSPIEEELDESDIPDDMPTLEVDDEVLDEVPEKPKTPKRPRPKREETNVPQNSQSGTGNINTGGGDINAPINIVNEGTTTTVINGRNVVIDVDGNIAKKPLDEVDKELADIQEQLAELKQRRVGGSISDKEYAQRRVDLADKKVALKLRKYAVPNGDATKGAPTVSYSGSSSRSTRKIDYYRQEFNLSPEDLEFIKYTNANNEYLRNEFGIDDIAIEDIRSYVPPLDVVKNLDSLTDDDVSFLAAYDEKISELTERRNSFLLDMMEQYFLITNKIKQSGLSDENKKSQIKEINDSFTEMMEQENQSHLDSLKKVVLYSAPLGRNGAGWSMTPERIASLGLPVDYEETLDREKYKIIAKILGEGNGVGPVQEFTGLQKSEIDALLQKSINHYFPNLGIKRPDIPGDGSFSRSKRETYRPLLGHTFEGYGKAEKKLSYSLEKLSKQNSAAKKLNDEEKNVIKKYFQIKNAEEPLRLLSDNDIKTLLNLISEEKLTTRNADLSAELLVVYRKEAEDLLIRELDIRSNPQKYKFGGNERKLENRFLSAKQLVDPKTTGVWETESLRAAWLYPDGRLYHVTVAHTKEHTYYDAFGDGLIRLSVSLAKEKGYKGRVNPPSLAIQAGDTAPTAEQMKTLDELIDEAKVEEVFYLAGASSEIHNPNAVIRDDSTYIEGERSGTIKSGNLKKKLKGELNAVGWAKLPDNDSSSRSKKDDGPDSDLSDEEFEIIDDFVNTDIDNIEPVEEEPADFRTRRARARKREEFLKDAVAQIITLSENAEKFRQGPDSGEVVGNLLEKVAKMFAAGDYGIVDKYERIVKEMGSETSPGKFFANAWYEYESMGAEAKLQRQKGGNVGKGKFVENIEALEAKITKGDGNFVLPTLTTEDDLSVGEIDKDAAKKIAFYDKFEEYLPLHAEIMGYVGSGMSASEISKQTGVPIKIVNAMKSNMAFIAEQLGDIENWPLDSLDMGYQEIAKLLPGDDMSSNLNIAMRLEKAKTFFETIEFDRDTGEISFEPISIAQRQINLERSNDIILSFFEDGKPAPSMEEIAEALGVTFDSVRGLLGRLRKKTGRKLKTGKLEEKSKKVDEEILSLFKDVENPPTMNELMKLTGTTWSSVGIRLDRLRENTGRELNLTTDDERVNNTILSFFKDGEKSPDMKEIMKVTGLAYKAIHKRLVRLRKKTGRELKLDGNNQDSQKAKDDLILSLFEDGKTPPTLETLAKATGLSKNQLTNRVSRLRKKTGKKLPIAMGRPRTKKPKLEIIPPKEK